MNPIVKQLNVIVLALVLTALAVPIILWTFVYMVVEPVLLLLFHRRIEWLMQITTGAILAVGLTILFTHI